MDMGHLEMSAIRSMKFPFHQMNVHLQRHACNLHHD
jgi:hypothetical protein